MNPNCNSSSKSFPLCADAKVKFKYGNVFYDKGDINQAIDLYTQSINSSENAITYVFRASAYTKLGKYQEAEVDFAKALELDGECFEAYKRRALTRLKGCVEDLEIALKLKPDHQKLKYLHTNVKALCLL